MLFIRCWNGGGGYPLLYLPWGEFLYYLTFVRVGSPPSLYEVEGERLHVFCLPWSVERHVICPF